jgi:hypothetical protein
MKSFCRVFWVGIEDEWTDFLTNRSTCFYLIGSRSLDNIKLASSWLRDMCSVDKESAVKLVVKSTQEYFNSAFNYYDPVMGFACACLQLVDIDPNVDHDHYLISAMKLITDFNLNLLPIQVRLHQSRIDIVKDILAKNKGSYKEYENLLRLANLLSFDGCRSKGSQEFECGIMLPICETALENDNLQISLKMCDTLMHYNYAKSKTACHNVQLP